MASEFTPKYYPLNPDGTVCRTPKTKAKKDEKVKSKKGDQGVSTTTVEYDLTQYVYCCPITACASRFTKEESLTVHMKNQHENKPFKMPKGQVENQDFADRACQVCGEIFSGRDVLQSHIKPVCPQKKGALCFYHIILY